MTTKSLPTYLLLLRKENELTQEQLAKCLNITRANYSHYETGRISPSFDILCKLSRIYNIPVTRFAQFYDVAGVSGDVMPQYIAASKKVKVPSAKKLQFYFSMLPSMEKKYLMSLARIMVEDNLS